MKKTFFEGMKKLVAEALEGEALELLDLEEKQAVNKETGEVSQFVSVSFLTPRGFSVFSRCAGTVKILNSRMKVKREELDNIEMEVVFKDIEVSYVDGAGNVYFRASDYDVRKVGA